VVVDLGKQGGGGGGGGRGGRCPPQGNTFHTLFRERGKRRVLPGGRSLELSMIFFQGKEENSCLSWSGRGYQGERSVEEVEKKRISPPPIPKKKKKEWGGGRFKKKGKNHGSIRC